MTLLNAIILPFQAGCENIITASSKPRELSVTKRIFENNHYQYELQSDNSLFSWQGRVSMFTKGVVLCLPFIGHITSIALRCFSSSIFPEMPLDFAIKCSPEQQLDIAKCFYTHKPESVDQATRLKLAKILADNKEGLDLLAAHISYLDLTTDVAFSLKTIQEKLLGPNKTVLEQNINNPQFAKQILGLLDQCPPEQQLAIAQQFYRNKPESVDQTARLTLAKILAKDAGGLDLLVANILYLDLIIDAEFSLEIIQQKPEVLDQINDPQFAKQILGLLDQCPPEQQLAIAQQFYRNKPERVDQATRLKLAKILAKDAGALDLLVANILYLDLIIDAEFSLEIIQQKPEVLDQINDPQFAEQLFDLLQEASLERKLAIAEFVLSKPKSDDKIFMELIRILINESANIPDEKKSSFIEILQQNASLFAKQLLQKNPTDYRSISNFFSSLDLNEDLTKKLIKEIILQSKKTQFSHNPHQRNLAIIQALENHTDKDFIEHLLKDEDSNIALADILLSDEKGCNTVIANIQYLNLIQNIPFSQKLFQTNSTSEKIKQHFVTQILQQDSTDRKFIISLLESLNLNEKTYVEIIDELLHQMDSSSEQMQVAIAHTIIEKHPRDSSVLFSKIDLFVHTQEFRDFLLTVPGGEYYITHNSDKFDLLDEQEKNTLLQSAP